MRVATHVSIIDKGTNVYQDAIEAFASDEQSRPAIFPPDRGSPASSQ
jgi:hypothetical protein